MLQKDHPTTDTTLRTAVDQYTAKTEEQQTMAEAAMNPTAETREDISLTVDRQVQKTVTGVMKVHHVLPLQTAMFIQKETTAVGILILTDQLRQRQVLHNQAGNTETLHRATNAAEDRNARLIWEAEVRDGLMAENRRQYVQLHPKEVPHQDLHAPNPDLTIQVAVRARKEAAEVPVNTFKSILKPHQKTRWWGLF